MNKTRVYNLILILAVISMAAGLIGCKDESGKKDDIVFAVDKEFLRGPLTVHLRIDKSEMSIADTFFLEFEAAIDPAYTVTMPAVDQVLKNFGIRDWRDLGQKLDDQGNIVKTYRYRLEPLVSGDFELAPFAFEFTENETDSAVEAKVYTLETTPVEIKVTSLLGEDLAELKIAEIEGVVDIAAKPLSWWLWAIPAGVVIVIALLVLLLRRKRNVKLIRIFRPAHEVAYARIQALIQADLIESGRIKEFYQRISNILRHYIEDRFALRAPEQTTEEFLYALQSADSPDRSIPQADRDRLAEFMLHCDLVKFAKHQPDTERIQRTFDLVKEFIERTRSDQYKIDVTETQTENMEAQA
ncbi:MAG: hypothetical protein KAS23_10680 [Anaerohalosphaera sp.]|nr:hypothetical protein [Anaerohalosphaera sp.]